MLRIVHTADLHIGVESYGRIDAATGLSTRLADFLAAFDEVVDRAIDLQADLFLFCGDAYKNREPSQTHQREFARRIARLSAAGIPVVLLVGNHDLPNATARATAVDIFATLPVANVTVADRPDVLWISTKSGPVQVAALPWPRQSSLVARDEYKNASLEQIQRAMRHALASRIQSLARQIDPGAPSILAAHIALSEAKAGSEQRMIVGQDPVLLRSDIPGVVFDYVALGHMHRHQTISERPLSVYPGSLQAIDFGEEGEDKGFCIVELDPAKPAGARATMAFHRVACRRFLTIKVHADSDDPTATVLRAIAREDVADAIVRVYIDISLDKEPLLREGEVRSALRSAHYLAGVIKNVARRDRARLSEGIEQMLPMQVLERYLREVRKAPAERVKVLLEYGQRLVQGEIEL